MRVVKRNLEFTSREDSTWMLVPLGDIHFGNRFCDYDHLLRTISFIKEHPRTVWIGMGDYGDAISAGDRRHDYNIIDDTYKTPDKQYRWLTEQLSQISDKCLCLLDGNHDYLHWQRHNHNYVESMAYDLKVTYVGISGYIRLNFRRNTKNTSSKKVLNIYAHHGWTGARTDSWKVKVIQDLSDHFPGLHCYLMGHVHQIGEAPPKIHLWVDQGQNIRHFTERFIFTGSYLKGYEEGIGSYVEAKGYKPTGLGSPIIEIRPNDVLKRGDLSMPPFSIRVMDLSFFA